MDLTISVIVIIAVILLVAPTISVARGIFARGRLRGIEEAIRELTRVLARTMNMAASKFPSVLASALNARGKCRCDVPPEVEEISLLMQCARREIEVSAGMLLRDPELTFKSQATWKREPISRRRLAGIRESGEGGRSSRSEAVRIQNEDGKPVQADYRPPIWESGTQRRCGAHWQLAGYLLTLTLIGDMAAAQDLRERVPLR